MDVGGEGPEEGLGRRGDVVRRKNVEEDCGWAVTCHGFWPVCNRKITKDTVRDDFETRRFGLTS